MLFPLSQAAGWSRLCLTPTPIFTAEGNPDVRHLAHRRSIRFDWYCVNADTVKATYAFSDAHRALTRGVRD